jgi:hypothetical protein
LFALAICIAMLELNGPPAFGRRNRLLGFDAAEATGVPNEEQILCWPSPSSGPKVLKAGGFWIAPDGLPDSLGFGEPIGRAMLKGLA